MAQEVQGTALEEVLVEEGPDGYLRLDYTSLHALEIRLIQELLNNMEAQEQRREEQP